MSLNRRASSRVRDSPEVGGYDTAIAFEIVDRLQTPLLANWHPEQSFEMILDLQEQMGGSTRFAFVYFMGP